MMMNEDWFMPTLNLDEIDNECPDLDFIVDKCRPLSVEYCMSNNFAFGGVNTSIIVKRYQS
jgi:3-oxoacyl-[acyl-carrier-protein] synthase II